MAVAAPEHEQGHEVVGVAEAVAHPHVTLILLLMASTCPLLMPSSTAAMMSSRRGAPSSPRDDLGDLAVGGPVHPVVEQLGGLEPWLPEDGPQVLLELPGPTSREPALERLEPRPLAVGEVLGVLHERVAVALDGGRLLLERPDLLGGSSPLAGLPRLPSAWACGPAAALRRSTPRSARRRARRSSTGPRGRGP